MISESCCSYFSSLLTKLMIVNWPWQQSVRWKTQSVQLKLQLYLKTDATTPNNVASLYTGLKVWPGVSNFAQQLPTTCNRVCKRTQYVTFLIQQCLELLANNVASVCTLLKNTEFKSCSYIYYTFCISHLRKHFLFSRSQLSLPCVLGLFYETAFPPFWILHYLLTGGFVWRYCHDPWDVCLWLERC